MGFSRKYAVRFSSARAVRSPGPAIQPTGTVAPVDPGARQQVVVLAEAHEGRGDQPRDSGLVDLVVAPHHPGVAGALAPAGLGVLLLQAGAPAVGLVIRASAEVGLDQLELGLEVLEQGGGLDHGVLNFFREIGGQREPPAGAERDGLAVKHRDVLAGLHGNE